MPTTSKPDRFIEAIQYLLREQISTAVHVMNNQQWGQMADLDLSIREDENLRFRPDIRRTLAALQQIRDGQAAVAEALDGIAALLYSAGVGKSRVALALGQHRATVSRRLEDHPLSALDELTVESFEVKKGVKGWRVVSPDEPEQLDTSSPPDGAEPEPDSSGQ